MTRVCEYIQERLSEDGLAGLRHDAESMAHLGSCDDCFEFLVALQEVNVRLSALEPVQPPASLLESTLERTRLAGSPPAVRDVAWTAGPQPSAVATDLLETIAAPETVSGRSSARSLLPPRDTAADTAAAPETVSGRSSAQSLLPPRDAGADSAPEAFENTDSAREAVEITGLPPVLKSGAVSPEPSPSHGRWKGWSAMATWLRVAINGLLGSLRWLTRSRTRSLVAAGATLAMLLVLGSVSLFMTRGGNRSDMAAPQVAALPEQGTEVYYLGEDHVRQLPRDSTAEVGRTPREAGQGWDDGGGQTATTETGDLRHLAATGDEDDTGWRGEDEELTAGDDSRRSASRNLQLAVSRPSGPSQVGADEGVAAVVTPGSSLDPYRDATNGVMLPSAEPTEQYRGGLVDLYGTLQLQLGPPPTDEPVAVVRGEGEVTEREATRSAFEPTQPFARVEARRLPIDATSTEPEITGIPLAGSLRAPRDGGGEERLEATLPATPPVPSADVSQLDGRFPAALPARPVDPDVDRFRRFLAERARVTGLNFQEPRGYWANTYLPGDPVLRSLQRRLTETRDTTITGSGQSGFSLASQSRMVAQPFDAPTASALGVYLAADHSGVQGESRVLLQVGVQGTAREHGRRPAMNIGVVVDLTDAVDGVAASSIQALLSALSEASEIGDRFSLTVAGRPGGTVITPGSFRYGEVLVAMQPLFSPLPAAGQPAELATLDLLDAFAAAVDAVRTEDDPNQPLGSSAVILVTGRTIEPQTHRMLEGMAHQAAVEGIPVSVVAVGRSVDLTQLDRIALAGQGSRRLLDSPGQAGDIVADELTAASRAVARAVRLRIRLAAGVQLVDVLGSYRLDEAGAQRVRDAEQSIDRRLSRTLGIQADRGEDEDGIQIVIPVFYAEDSHVILLDLVVPGPGPVVEVTARYKDLVRLRNNVARDQLSLRRGSPTPGPLERNVFKNLLAFELSRTLMQAGDLLRQGQTGEAVAALSGFSSLLEGIRREMPELAPDPEIETDLAMLARYLVAVRTVAGRNQPPPGDLTDSLLYASYLKQLPPPGGDGL